jgi:hypothetical protein
VSLGFDLEHAESAVLVEKRDALNKPRKTFRHSCGCVLHRALILELIIKYGKPPSENREEVGLREKTDTGKERHKEIKPL